MLEQNDTKYSNLLVKYDLYLLASLLFLNRNNKEITKTLEISDVPRFKDLKKKIKRICAGKSFEFKKKEYNHKIKDLASTKRKTTNLPTENEFSLTKPIHSLVNDKSLYSNCKNDENRSSESITAKESSDMLYNSAIINEVNTQNISATTKAYEYNNVFFIDYNHSEYINETKINTQNSATYLDSKSSENYLPDILELPLGKSNDPIRPRRKRLISDVDSYSFGELKKLRTDEKIGFKQ